MRKIVLFAIQIVLCVGLLVSCKKERTQDSLAVSGAEGSCYQSAVPLWIGATKTAGVVIISNDATNVYVNFKLDEVINFQEGADNVKLWIGDDLSKLALLDCAPELAKFPWKATVNAEAENHVFTIPFSSLSNYFGNSISCTSKLYVVCYANLDVYSSNEIAFGGNKFRDCANQWWYTTEYDPICCR